LLLFKNKETKSYNSKKTGTINNKSITTGNKAKSTQNIEDLIGQAFGAATDIAVTEAETDIQDDSEERAELFRQRNAANNEKERQIRAANEEKERQIRAANEEKERQMRLAHQGEREKREYVIQQELIGSYAKLFIDSVDYSNKTLGNETTSQILELGKELAGAFGRTILLDELN
jgi:hypothetical protein